MSTHGFWLNLLAPLLKALFAWNHDWVMRHDERALTDYLRKDGRSTAES